MGVTLCTVTPVYRGADYLRELVREIDRLRMSWRRDNSPIELIESIFVDDGSIDSSASVLEELAVEFPWVTVVTLSRNVGQHAATVAGICHSSSDWVVTLDEDMQHRPAEIENMLAKAINVGADVCYARPRTPVHGGSWRDKASVYTKSVLSRLVNLPQIKEFNSFRLIRGSIARAAAAASTSYTYLDIAISWYSNSYVSVWLNMEDKRFVLHKSSGYGLGKLVRHARNLLVSSSLDIASKGLVLGGVTIIMAALLGAGVVLQKFFFPEIIASPGWASLVALVSFFGGVVIALLCIVLEYLHVLVLEKLGKPTFFTVNRESDVRLRKWLEREALSGAESG